MFPFLLFLLREIFSINHYQFIPHLFHFVHLSFTTSFVFFFFFFLVGLIMYNITFRRRLVFFWLRSLLDCEMMKYTHTHTHTPKEANDDQRSETPRILFIFFYFYHFFVGLLFYINVLYYFIFVYIL